MMMRIIMFLKFLIKSATFKSNEKILTCQGTFYNDLTNKQNVFDNFVFNERYNESTAFDNEILTFNDVEDIDSYDVYSVKHDKDQPTLNKNLSSSSDYSLFDFLDNVDYVDVPEELERLNNFELKVLNPRDVEEVLKHEENLNKINVKVTKDCNSFILENKQKNSIKDQKRETKNKYTFETDLVKRHDIVTKKYMQKIKCNLLHFIKKMIPDYYVYFYIKRLTDLERAFSGVNFFECKNYNALSSRDCELVTVLTKLLSNFDKSKVYNQETYQGFNYDLSLVISEECVTFYCVPIVNLSKKYERYFFCAEMMKLYKYIYEFPELLKIAEIYKDSIFCGFTFFIHLINLFAEKIGFLKDNRVFILCLINKAFLYSEQHRLDFFFFTKYRIICSKKHTKFDFLLWEIHFSKRANMKKRKKFKGKVTCSKRDEVHFKVVLLIYLYRHFEFLMFYNFNEEEISNFCLFIDKVLLSQDCFACLFDEYLEIVKRQTSSLK